MSASDADLGAPQPNRDERVRLAAPDAAEDAARSRQDSSSAAEATKPLDEKRDPLESKYAGFSVSQLEEARDRLQRDLQARQEIVAREKRANGTAERIPRQKSSPQPDDFTAEPAGEAYFAKTITYSSKKDYAEVVRFAKGMDPEMDRLYDEVAWIRSALAKK